MLNGQRDEDLIFKLYLCSCGSTYYSKFNRMYITELRLDFLYLLLRSFERVLYRLESKSTASPTDALMFCNNKAFLNFLEDDSLHTEQKSDWVDLILATLNQALQADDTMSDSLGSSESLLLS